MSVSLRSPKIDEARAWPIIHPTADVSPSAQIGAGTFIWHRAHVREYANIGSNCMIGKDVYVDYEVHIGSNVKIQNGAQIYHGTAIDDGVFIGPLVCLTNDQHPRAVTANGALKKQSDWTAGKTKIHYGASLGAGAIIMAGLEIGRFAMIGAGAVVTHDVPDYGIFVGAPAQLVGYACPCGQRLILEGHTGRCPVCGGKVEITATQP